MEISIFDFENYRDYLSKVILPQGSYNQQGSNLSRWSEKLGHKSPSLLSMVLNGQRLPSKGLLDSLVKELKLTKKESDYLKLKVQLERAQKKGSVGLEMRDELNKLRESVSKVRGKDIDLSHFETIAQWYCTAIKQLISTPEFIEDENWISKRLRNKVRPHQVKKAIEYLLQVKAVQRNEEGRLFVTHGIRTTNNIPSEAIIQHHLGMVDQAREALTDLPIDRRQFNSLTFRMSEKRMSEFKKEMMSFVEEMNTKYSSDESHHVYQLNLNLFELTDSDAHRERLQ